MIIHSQYIFMSEVFPLRNLEIYILYHVDWLQDIDLASCATAGLQCRGRWNSDQHHHHFAATTNRMTSCSDSHVTSHPESNITISVPTS